jgi:MerR family transcriptional regulator, light-induced transcriptional regulator
MTAIADLPTEPKFTIKAVASQTGIRPVTLRAWERRHEVLTPHRSDNHYRLYSERDIAILRWLKYRVDDGMPIGSAVNALRSMANNNIWPEAIPLVPSMTLPSSAAPSVDYARQLARCLILHDENRAADLLREVHSRLDLMTAINEVLSPAIRYIEELWYRGQITTEVKRFASTYLREKMLSLFQAYPSRHSAPFIMIGCAPMEVHELDSLMLAVLLRSRGYRVDYLGPDINIEDLADYASYEMPAMVILWANSEFTAREMRPMHGLLKKRHSTPQFAYAGDAFIRQPHLKKEILGIHLGGSFETALDQIKDLLKSPVKHARRARKELVS